MQVTDKKTIGELDDATVKKQGQGYQVELPDERVDARPNLFMWRGSDEVEVCC